MTKKYVYQNAEVILTGRIAEKKLRKSTDTLYEITPLDKETGSWKKWVRLNDLHEIVVDKDPPPPLTFVPKPIPPAGTIRKEKEQPPKPAEPQNTTIKEWDPE